MNKVPIDLNKCAETDCQTRMNSAFGIPRYCPEHNDMNINKLEPSINMSLNKLSKCCNAPIVLSGIPFDGTNSTYTKMCKVCGHHVNLPERDNLVRDINIILSPLEDTSCTHADIVIFKEKLFKLVFSFVETKDKKTVELVTKLFFECGKREDRVELEDVLKLLNK